MEFNTNNKFKFTIEFELEQISKTIFSPKQDDIKKELILHLMEFIEGGDDLKKRLQNEILEFKELSIPSNECWDCYDTFIIKNVK